MMNLLKLLLILIPFQLWAQPMSINNKGIDASGSKGVLRSNIVNQPDPRERIVLICDGQSNSVGRVSVKTNLPEHYKNIQNQIYIWNPRLPATAPCFEKMEVGINTCGAEDPPNMNWGSEQSLAHDIIDSLGYNKLLYVIKNSLGAQAISYWEKPTGSRWVSLDTAIKRANRYFADSIVPKYIVCWIQGESDCASDGRLAYKYEYCLMNLIDNVRGQDPNLKEVPYFTWKIFYPMSMVDSLEYVVNQGFDAVSVRRSNVFTLDPNSIGGFSCGNDPTHYNDTSLLKIGHKMFSKINSEGYLE